MREHARQSRASSWPSCFKMSSAFVYIEENLLLRSGKLRKRERLSSFLSLSLSLAPLFFFYAARSFLILPFSPFVSFQLVFLFSPSRRPLFNFRSLSHDASIVYLSLPLSFFVSSSFCTCSLRERERGRGYG